MVGGFPSIYAIST